MRKLLALITLIVVTDLARTSGNKIDQRTNSDSLSVLSTDQEDYRHNIKMLTGVEDVRRVTEYRGSGDTAEEAEAPAESKKDNATEPAKVEEPKKADDSKKSEEPKKEAETDKKKIPEIKPQQVSQSGGLFNWWFQGSVFKKIASFLQLNW